MARTPFKQRSQGSSFKMMGSSSPVKRAGRWIINDEGERVQVGEQDILAHKKKLETAEIDAQEIGRDFTVNPGLMPTAFEESKKGKLIQEERDALVTELSDKTSTTGKESLDAIKAEMTAKEKKQYGGVGHEGYQATKSKEWKKAYELAQKQKTEEEASGVAANQKELDAAALIKAKAKSTKA